MTLRERCEALVREFEQAAAHFSRNKGDAAIARWRAVHAMVGKWRTGGYVHHVDQCADELERVLHRPTSQGQPKANQGTGYGFWW